jgi:hypothetical protein
MAAANGAHLAASMWVNPTVQSGTILGYLTGGLDVAMLAEWDAVEVTAEQALSFAEILDSNAYVDADGVIATTTVIDP